MLLAKDYFDATTQMHFAHLKSAERIGPKLHTHDFFELFLITGGQIEHIVNNKKQRVIEGDLVFIRPADCHYYKKVRGYGCQMINLAVTHKVIHELFAYLGQGFKQTNLLNAELPPNLHLGKTSKTAIQAKLERLNAFSAERAEEKRTALRILLFELVAQFFPRLSDSSSETTPLWLRQACQALEEPENLRLGVNKLSHLAGVSPEHLARTFKKHFQKTPTMYVNDLRLTYAANLLSHGDKDILDIASEVGFNSLSHFYALFKKQYRLTPRKYRLKHLVHLN